MTASEKTYEMQWDCEYCGAKKLLGLSQRYCPTCGGPQNPAKRYFPAESDKVAVEDHPFVGADATCPACRHAMSRACNNCSNCGSPIDAGKQVAMHGGQQQGAGGQWQPAESTEARGGASASKRKIGLIVGLIVMALVVGAYERHRRLAASLAARRTELDLTHRSMQTQLHEVHRAVVAHVHQLVDPFLVAIDRLVKRIDHGSDAAPIADAMRKIADEQLRPLSQRLLNSASGVSPDDFKPVSGELPALPLPSHLHMHVLISPLAGLIVTILSFSQAMRLAADPAILLLPIISGLVPILVFAGARAVIGGWAPRLWLGIAVAGGIGVLGLVLSVTVEEALGLPVPEYLMYAAPLTGLLLGLSTATYAAVSYRRSETERELQGYIDALRTASSLLTQHLFIEQRNLSYVIHGSLQSALYAGSMRLLANPLPSQELVAAIRRDIALAAQKLDAHAVVAVRLEQTLYELSRMWSGECEVRWTMSERAELLLAAAPVTEASVGEIAREFITNAIRHGKATTVMVRIVVEQGCVQVTCDDDGRGVSASASRGVGSRMLDELCIRWDRTRDGLHTSVTADVAIAH